MVIFLVTTVAAEWITASVDSFMSLQTGCMVIIVVTPVAAECFSQLWILSCLSRFLPAALVRFYFVISSFRRHLQFFFLVYPNMRFHFSGYVTLSGGSQFLLEVYPWRCSALLLHFLWPLCASFNQTSWARLFSIFTYNCMSQSKQLNCRSSWHEIQFTRVVMLDFHGISCHEFLVTMEAAEWFFIRSWCFM